MPDAFASDVFGKPPAEVLRFFDSKGIKESFHWQDFGFEEHAHAFTVAKSTGYDILGDIKGAVSQALHERQDFDDFRRGLEPLLRQKGWWGKATERDPLSGEEKEVQLGSARRLKTIYWANVNTAYAAGEWERIDRTKDDLPFLQYLISIAVHKRLEHLAWVGTILLVVDVWWETHYPPSAWLCQCRVRQLSVGQARRFGYNFENPERPESFGVQDFVNKRTGEVTRVPVGVDPGWATNPGKTRMKTAADFLVGKIDSMDANMRRIAVEDLAGSWLMKRIQSGEIPYDRESSDPANINRGKIMAPIAALPAALADAIGAKSLTVRLSVADATKQIQKKRNSYLTAASYQIVQGLLDTGEIVQEKATEFVAQGKVNGKFWYAAFRRAAAAPEEIYLKSFRRMREDELDAVRKRGEIIREGTSTTGEDEAP